MNFFASQEAARRQSRWLIWAFAVSVALVVFAIDLVVLILLRGLDAEHAMEDGASLSLGGWSAAHPGYVVFTTFAVLAFIGCASAYKVLLLRGGGGVVARSLGGVRIDRGTPDPLRKRLLNVVEEMAIASGVPMPEVYVLEQETAINALSAGHTAANAAVAVTQGTLQRLNREQLQGVIAHEFSHILNGDMRLSIRLMGLVFGLLAMALVARTLLRLSRAADRKAAPLILVVFAIMIIGYVGLFCGRFIQAWISRRRESLADASAVQFTRNPEGIKAALLRAAAQGRARGFNSADTEEVAHMLFLSAGQRAMATHPPILERLQAIEPRFKQADLDAAVLELQRQWARESAGELAAADAPEVRTRAAAVGVGALGGAGPLLMAASIAATAGDPGTRHIEHAQELRAALPEDLDSFAATPERARSLMCALLLSRDATVCERQLVFVARELGEQEVAAVRGELQLARDLAPPLRLPAVLRLFPVLRQFPAAQRKQLMDLLLLLARCDAGVDVFEYALCKLVSCSLQDEIKARPPHGSDSLEDRTAELGVVFAVLAHHGAGDAEVARQAYEAGIAPLLPRLRPAYAFPEDWAPAFDAALDKLATLRPAGKELLIEGLVRTVGHDNHLAVEEAELLRAVCAVLQCPLPPILPS